MKPLSTYDIERALVRVPAVWAMYQGTHPHTHLRHLHHLRLPAMLVVNTDPHNLPGRHWICIYIDGQRQGDVFDPLATPLSNTVIQFMNMWARKWVTNSVMVQHPLAHSCGIYVIYYLTHRLCTASMSELMQTWSANLAKNEVLMYDFYRRLQ